MIAVLLSEFGNFKVVQRDRVRSSPSRGLRGQWTEYQVLMGNRILSRHERLLNAENEARRLNQELWDEIERQSRAAHGDRPRADVVDDACDSCRGSYLVAWRPPAEAGDGVPTNERGEGR